MTQDEARLAAMRQLIEDDAVGQLRRRDGLMATLGSEDGAVKLDWVEGVARLLADPTALEMVEAEARDIRQRGIRHVIWAGMGGSVMAVHVLCDLGLCGGRKNSDPPHHQGESIAIYPLDSTDPAALNAIVRKLAAAKEIPLPAAQASTERDTPSQPGFLRTLLHDVMMIGVAMGMTSEEPITHLTWFIELLARAHLPPAEHLLVMTLPGSYLDAFAREHQAPSRPLQLDGGTGTGGRMSAPTTRVFLLPAALALAHLPGASGPLRSVLRHAWNEYALDLAATHPAEHPFVRLAAALSAASAGGACRLLLRMPEGWQALVPWIEQLMEESLGKGGKGVVVFDDQTLNPSAPGYRQSGMLRVSVVTAGITKATDQHVTLAQPSLARADAPQRLAALAASFLGWQLSMALYGYLQRIPFAGQPAVENYKARARALRAQPDPLQVASSWHPALQDGPLTLLAPRSIIGQDVQARGVSRRGGPDTAEQEPAVSLPAEAFARVVHDALAADDADGHHQDIPLGYLDVTVNGEAPADLLVMLDKHARAIGNARLGIPVKLRRAPAAYHATEQSEMDGPPYLVSLRLVARDSNACLLGTYTTAFLHAQAVSTWQAMLEAGRPCCLLVLDGTLANAHERLATFFAQLERHLRQA